MRARSRPKPVRPTSAPSNRQRTPPATVSAETAVLIVVVAAVFGSFWPSLSNGFVDWDDSGMFINNYAFRGLSWPHLKWMFTTTHYAHYHPLTWITLGLDYKLWGMNAAGYHFTNVLLQACNALLLYWFIRMLFRAVTISQGVTPWAARLSAAVGALFFAIHPLRVESVAWATERRDVLSGVFYLLTLISYFRAHQQANSKNKWLVLSFVAFTFSFLCKAWGMTLPVVLLILDLFPLRRLEFGPGFGAKLKMLLLEKVPFMLIAAVFACVALKAQSVWGIKAHDFGVASRIMNCAYGLVFYPFKTILPFGLSPIYPLDPQFDPTEGKYIFCLFLGVAVTAFVLLGWRRWPWALSAWMCYAVIVSPVLGAAQSGEQIVADRYSYLACIPFAVLFAGLSFWLLNWAKSNLASGVLVTLVLAELTLLGSLTFQQSHAWHDNLSLWNQALKVDPNNWIALNGRGKYYLDNNELEKALSDFTLAIKLNPGRVAPWTNRGMIHQMQGRYDLALADYNASLKLDSNHSTYNNRGALKEVRGDLAGAMADYSKSIELDPGFHSARLNRGNLRKSVGDLKGALEDFSAMIACKPDDPDGYVKRGNVRANLKDQRGAAEDFARALKLAPTDWPQRQAVQEQLAAALRK